jgi:hypothetical protein
MAPLGRACARASGAKAAAETPATNSRRVNWFFGICYFGFQFTQVLVAHALLRAAFTLV